MFAEKGVNRNIKADDFPENGKKKEKSKYVNLNISLN